MKFGRLLQHFTLIFFVSTLLGTVLSFAGPGRTTYQAKIVKPDGYPLEASNVNFKFTILDPSATCVLYSETYSNVNMSSTSGLISFSLGSGVKTFPVSSTTFEQVFSNITPFLACDSGGPANYSPTATDMRRIVMQFNDGNGWQTLPAMSINAVPYAMYADDAMKFNGMQVSDFVQVTTIPSCGASEALRYNGSSFNCVAVGGSGAVTSGAVVTAFGYTPADGASVTALSSSLATTNSNVSSVSSTIASVSSTVFSVSSTVSSLSNTVSALVSSQWLTSGTTLSYEAGNVGVGTANPGYRLHVMKPVSGATTVGIESYDSTPGIYFLRANGTAAAPLPVSNTQSLLEIAAVGYGQTHYLNTSAAKILMSADENWSDATGAASIRFHTRGTSTTAPSLERMRIAHNGFVGIGTVSPATTLDINGGLRIGAESNSCTASLAGTLRYSGGLVEYCNGTTWSAFGVAGAGILAINGLTSGSQTFSFGSAGTTPSVSSVGAVHTFNFPYASETTTAAGLISYSDYLNFSNKLNATSSSVIAALTYTPANQTTVGTSFSAVTTSINNLSASVGAIVSSQWTTSGTTIHYTAGNVGIGTTNPDQRLTVSGSVHVINSGNILIDSGGYIGQASNKAIQFGSDTQFIGVNGAFAKFNTGASANSFVLDANNNVVMGTTAATTAYSNAKTIHIHQYSGSDAGLTDASVIHITNATTGSNATDGLYIGRAFDSSNGNQPANIFETRENEPIALRTDNQTRMVITGSGNIGIGTVSPTSTLQISRDTSAATILVETTAAAANQYPSVTVNKYGTGGHPGLYFNSAGGTASAPTATNTTLTRIIGSGHNGVTAIQGAQIYMYPETAWSVGNTPAGMQFFTNNGTAHTEKMTIMGNGNIGIGTITPSAKLQIAAGTSLTASLKISSGTLLTAAQDGAIEYDGTNLYYTDSTNTRRALASTGSGQTFSGTNTFSGVVNISNNTASTNSSTGALVVSGGVGIGGALNVSGSVISSYIAGSVASAGALTLDSTSHSSKGNILLAPSGGKVGIGTASPDEKLTVYDGNVSIPYVANKTHGYKLGLGNNLAYLWRNYQYADDSFFISQNWYADDAGTNVIPNAAHTTQAIEMRRHVGIMLKTGVSNTVPVARLTVDPEGSVGIGTTTPGARFHVTTPASGAVNARVVFGNSNADLMDVTGFSGDVYLDHAVGARYTATSSTTLNRAVTFKIDGAPNVASSPLTVGELLALWVQSGNVSFGGNLGIGVTSPTAALVVSKATTAGSQIQVNNSGVNGYITAPSSGEGIILSSSRYNGSNWVTDSTGAGAVTISDGAIQMFTNSGLTPGASHSYAERMRIDSNGYVGIGTSNPGAKLHILNGHEALENNAASAVGANISFWKNRNYAATQSGDELGYISFYGHDGAASLRGAYLISKVDGTPVSGSVPGNLQFYTTPSGGGDSTEKMRITAGGLVGIGTSNPSAKLHVKGNINSDLDSTGGILGQISVSGRNTSAATPYYTQWSIYNMKEYGPLTGLSFYEYYDANNNGILCEAGDTCASRVTFAAGGNVGIGLQNPTYLLQLVNDSAAKPGTNTWTIASDMRLKDSRGSFTRGMNELLGLETIYFTYKKDNALGLPSDKEYVGIRAQDAQKVIPESVSVDEKGFLHFTSDAVFWTAVNAIKQLYHKLIDHDAMFVKHEREIASIKEENQMLKQQNAEKDKQLRDIRIYLCDKDPTAPICK